MAHSRAMHFNNVCMKNESSIQLQNLYKMCVYVCGRSILHRVHISIKNQEMMTEMFISNGITPFSSFASNFSPLLLVFICLFLYCCLQQTFKNTANTHTHTQTVEVFTKTSVSHNVMSHFIYTICRTAITVSGYSNGYEV